MDEKERRDAFNMKVLKRHDPNITNILESAAFVVLYEIDEEWSKSGIEGPMFLYQRSIAPFYGFFVLNRNGVENFSANFSTQDDLELTDEFIIYRSDSDEQVLGIWVYNEDERKSIGQRMVNLHASSSSQTASSVPTALPSSNAAASSSSPSQPLQAGQSVNLDALFGSVSGNTNAHGASQSFASSSPTPNPPSSGTSLLDSIFQSASNGAAPPRPTYASPPSQLPSSLPQTSDPSADGLKALLGLPTSNVNSPAAANANAAAPSVPSSGDGTALPQGLEALFASAKVTPTPPKKEAVKEKQPTPSQTNGSSFSQVASSALNESFSRHSKPAEVLDRRDFIREVLSLIHTDKAFVDDLYQQYLSSAQ